MKTIANITVSDEIAKIIDNNLWLHPTKPMTFLMSNDGQTDIMMRKAKKLKKAFEKIGAEVNVIGVGQVFPEYMKLVVEITDPVAGSLEKYLA